MHTAPESPTSAPGPSHAARSLIDRLIAFRTVSRDSNLGLIEWARDYLHGHGAKTRLTYDATGKKANLFATLGDSPKPGLGHRPLRRHRARRETLCPRLSRHERIHRHRPRTSAPLRCRPQ
jgi:hypothetical protein